jgi:hypothetical protein
MTVATFRARAKNPGKCAVAGCGVPGSKIYEGDGLRLLACTQGHAEAAMQRVARAVAKTGATQAQRDEALRLFNEWGGPRPPQPEGPDEWDDII